MGGFIRARLIETVIISVVVSIGLNIIDFPNALILGLVAGVTNLVPYVGPIIGAVPALLIGLVDHMGPSELASIMAVYLIAQLIDIVLIIPFVVAKIVNLHPVTVVLVIILGAHLMGILGMIISIPAFSIMKVIASAVYDNITDFRS